jgi:hypothetical protein
MKTLIKNIDNNYNFGFDDLIFNNIIVNKNNLLKHLKNDEQYFLQIQKNISINDIKNFNERDKFLLTLFVNQYVNLKLTLPKYSIYSDFLVKPIQMTQKKYISKNFFVSNDVLTKCNIRFNHNNILNIGVMPTFLESYIHILNGKNNMSEKTLVNFDQINIKSTKEQLIEISNIYKDLLNDFKLTYPDINFINTDFYGSTINEILKNANIKEKYDLVIFGAYKNIIDSNKLNLQFDEHTELDNINGKRFISSLLHNKIIIKQIIFSINKLELNGDLVFVVSGFYLPLQNQLFILLKFLFREVILFHSDKDFSYRKYVVCKGFFNNLEIIQLLTKYLTQIDVDNNDDILISIFNTKNNFDFFNAPISFNKNQLTSKFNMINNKIQELTKFIENQKLIVKLYRHNYPIQLLNSYKALLNYLTFSGINNEIIVKLDDYKLKIFNNLVKPYEYNLKININDNDKYFKQVFEEISSKTDFGILLNKINYMKLFDLIIFSEKYLFDDFLSQQKKTILTLESVNKIPSYLHEIYNLIVSETNETNKINIDELNKNVYTIDDIINNKYNMVKIVLKNKINTVIINFNLHDVCPFFISNIYILSRLFKNMHIIKTNSMISYFSCVFFDLNESYLDGFEKNISKLITKYDEYIENNKINKNIILVQIDDFFIGEINNIIAKLILKELILSLKYKFIFNGESYTESFYSFSKQIKN